MTPRRDTTDILRAVYCECTLVVCRLYVVGCIETKICPRLRCAGVVSKEVEDVGGRSKRVGGRLFENEDANLRVR